MKFHWIISLLVFLNIQALAQQKNIEKDSVSLNKGHAVFYHLKMPQATNKLIVAVQGCYSNGFNFVNEVYPFVSSINADVVSVENNSRPFLNTTALKSIITKANQNTQYKEIYFVGFSCNAASGIAYGLENDIQWKGIIAFMPALDRVPFSYYAFGKTFCPIVIITGSKDFGYKANKTMVDILIKYNKKQVLLIDIPNAEHDFNLPNRDETLKKAFEFINSKK
jgi:predicted esterase